MPNSRSFARLAGAVIATSLLSPTFVLAQKPPPSAAGAVAGALGEAAAPKLAKPEAAPVVKPGEGGGPLSKPETSDPGATLTNFVTKLEAGKGPPGWSGPLAGLVPSGLNRISIELVTPDGQTRTFVREPSQSFIGLALGGQSRSAFEDGTTIITNLAAQDGGLVVNTAFGLKGDVLVLAPPLDMPLEGGTRTAALPGGGSVTVTLDGAHPLTPTELSRSAAMAASGARSAEIGARAYLEELTGRGR